MRKVIYCQRGSSGSFTRHLEKKKRRGVYRFPLSETLTRGREKKGKGLLFSFSRGKRGNPFFA